MRHVVPFASRPRLRPQPAKLGNAARWAAAWQRLRGTLFGMALEAARYLSGCPRSRLRQRAALRELDDRLLLDIGTTRRDAWAKRGGHAGSRATVARSAGREGDDVIIRELAAADSIADMTTLLHAAYARLGGMGFNYTAVDQTEDVTRSRIARGHCLVAVDRGALVGTIMFYPPGRSAGCPCYERPDVATIGQFGVLPNRQGAGTGTRLLRHAEDLAVASGAAELALDTSEGADHLVGWYEREGFRFVEHAQWEGKAYRSVIMSKPVRSRGGA